MKGNANLNQDIIIPDGTNLTIEENATLNIESNVTITNNGNITNNGTINNNGNLQNVGAIDNSTGNINNMGNLQNTGTIENTNGNINSVTDIENVTGNDIKLILYSVTVKANHGGKVDPNESFQVRHGDSQTFNILPNPGYKIKSVIINGSDRTNDIINGQLTLLDITENIDITIEFDKLPDTSSKIHIAEKMDMIENPKTADPILFYIGLEFVSMIGLALVSLSLKKYIHN